MLLFALQDGLQEVPHEILDWLHGPDLKIQRFHSKFPIGKGDPLSSTCQSIQTGDEVLHLHFDQICIPSFVKIWGSFWVGWTVFKAIPNTSQHTNLSLPASRVPKSP